MNRAKGIHWRGFRLVVQDNWRSIDGLMHLSNGRNGVATGAGNSVLSWADQSRMENHLNSRPQKVELVNGGFLKSTEANACLVSAKKDYKFLSDGSKYGIYIIMRPIMSLDVPTTALGALATTTSAGIGLQGTIGSGVGMGRFGFIVRGGTTIQSRTINNLLNPAHANYSPSGKVYAASFVNFGNKIHIRYGSKFLETTPFFPTLAEYPQTNNTTFLVCSGVTGLTLNLAHLAIYNWGQMPEEVINGFDIRARALQAKETLEFEKLVA